MTRKTRRRVSRQERTRSAFVAALAQIAALTEELRKSNEAAARMRQDAADTREKATAMGGQLEAAEIEGDTARRQAKRGEQSAQAALDANHAAQAAEAAKVADAQRASQLLAQQRAELQSRIASHEASKSAATAGGRPKVEVEARGGEKVEVEARGGERKFNIPLSTSTSSLDLNSTSTSSLNLNSTSTSSLHLRAAQDAAQNVNHAADTAINALTETLRSVESRLKAAQSYLESQSKQQRNAWSEAPAGS